MLAGASAIQLFDSLGRGAARACTHSMWPRTPLMFSPPSPTWVYQVSTSASVPTTLAPQMADVGCDVLGVDFRVELTDVDQHIRARMPLQGNLDPTVLLTDVATIEAEVRRVLESGRGLRGHIFNLGHGVLPDTDADMVTAAVQRRGAPRPAIRGGNMTQLPHIVVVGGGVSGLAAAWFPDPRAPRSARARVTVLESADELGGKLRVQQVGGLIWILVRRPCWRPARRPSACVANWVWRLSPPRPPRRPSTVVAPCGPSRRSAHRRPDRSATVGGQRHHVATRAAADPTGPPLATDRSARRRVSRRFREHPLGLRGNGPVGGTHAGQGVCGQGGFAEPADDGTGVVPGGDPASVCAAGGRLGSGRGTQCQGPRKGPIFVGIEGGVGRLATVLADVLRDTGVDLQTKAVVQQVRKRGDLWDVVVGDGRGKYRTVEADAVPLATPATASADLLESVNQAASDELRAIEYADVAVVTLGYPADQARHLRGSGFLVPPVEGLTVKG